MSRFDEYYSDADRAEDVRVALFHQKRWELDIAKFQDLGAKDRATAIRWDMQAMDAYHGGELDVGYYCYLRGIDYQLERPIAKELR